MPQAVPSRIIWRRPLVVRQPYSVAVLSTGGRLHPRFLRKRSLGRKWSSPCRRDGEVEKAFFKGKEGRVGFRKSQWMHEFINKHSVWEEGMIGNRAGSMAALFYNKILGF